VNKIARFGGTNIERRYQDSKPCSA